MIASWRARASTTSTSTTSRSPSASSWCSRASSGSGKSTLAFDTLYAEGQRRYVETLSAYARQFLGQLERPQVERIRGLSPTIAIEQKSASTQPALDRRHHHRDLRLPARALRARRRAALPQVRQARSRAQRRARSSTSCCALPERHAASRCSRRWSRTARASSGSCSTSCARRGFVRVRIDGEIVRARRRRPRSTRSKKHTIELVVDRVDRQRERPRRASPRASSPRCARARAS